MTTEDGRHGHRGGVRPAGLVLEDRHDCRGRDQRVRSIAALCEVFRNVEARGLKGLVHPRDLDLKRGAGLADVVTAGEPGKEGARSREIVVERL